jgi:hypothetical protein
MIVHGFVLVAIALGLWMAQGAEAPDAGSTPSGATQVVRPPRFDPPGGVYASNLMVQLDGGGAEVRYTVDGSEPTRSSLLYTNPIPVVRTTRLRARAFTATASSPPVSQTYTLLDPALAGFDSNLPLLVLNTFGAELSAEVKVPVTVRFIKPAPNGRTRLTGAGDFDGLGMIRHRGFSSLRYPKKSFALETKTETGADLKVPILGLPEDADWVLYAPYPDKTLIRDVLAYEMSNAIGRYAPRTRFIELFLNPGADRLCPKHYMGVYVLVEKIKRSPYRVNIAPLRPEHSTEPAITGGYIFKKDHLEKIGIDDAPPLPRSRLAQASVLPSGPGGFPADPAGFDTHKSWPATQLMGFKPQAGRLVATTNGFVSAKGNAFFYVEPKPEHITPAQRAWLSNYVNQFEAALYGPNFRDPTNGYAAFIDVDSFIDHHILVEATKNVDGFRFSTFFTKDRGGKLQLGPIWDWNLAFGNCRGKEGYLPAGWYWPQLDDYQYSWFRRLFEDPDFGQRYVDRWAQLRTNQLATERILRRIDELATWLKEPADRNFKRWPILGEAVVPNYFVGSTYAEEIDWMKKWITTRLAWIDKQFPPVPSAAVHTSTNGVTVTLTAPAAKIFYTTDGSDPRAPGGGVSPKAQLYQGPIQVSPGTRLMARLQQDTRWSAPAQLTLPEDARSGSGTR